MAASLETNKTLAALLTAGIIASGSGVVSRILYHPHVPEENAYVIEVPEAAAQKGEAATAEAVPLPALLAQANPEKGASEAKKCAACHSEEKGGAIKIGPPLWGVVGRDIASVEGFEYSDALRGKEGQWTYENIFEFIHGPKEWAPGTKMTFAGIKSPEGRANLLVYLRTLSDQPVPLPEAAAAAPGPEQTAANEPASPTAPGEQSAAGQQPAASAPAGASQPTAAAEPAAPAPATQASGEQAEAGQQPAASGPAETGQQTAAAEPAAPAAATANSGEQAEAGQQPAASGPAETGQQTAAAEPAPAAATANSGEQAEAGQQPAASGPAETGQQTAAAEPAAPAAATANSGEQAEAGQQPAASGPAETGQQTAAVREPAPEGAAPAGAAGGVFALLAHADPAAGAKDARKCAVCHNFEEGGSAKLGPPLWGVIGRDIASVEGFAYSEALTGKEGAWDYERLDAFLAQPRNWAKGTKMAFAGLKKPEERADVILYLRSLSHDPAPLP
jgi:cytochrome c2